jgi:hypothetical protein
VTFQEGIGRARPERPSAYEAIVSNDATGTQDAYVRIPAFDELQRFGPCRRASGTVTRGDRCLVMFDNAGRPWIVALED